MTRDPHMILTGFLCLVAVRVIYLKIRYTARSRANGGTLEPRSILAMTVEVVVYIALAYLWITYWGIGT